MANNHRLWEPEFSSDCKLRGPYPEVIALCDESIPVPDWEQEPRLVISDDKNVKRICLTGNCSEIEYLVISNLPVLVEIELAFKPSVNLKSFQWISISDVPLLRRVVLRGDVCSLEIQNAKSLVNLDVGGCPDLDYVRVTDASPETRVNALGCVKLRGIHGDLEMNNSLADQIQKNQSKSRFDGLLYESMTFTDIDLLLDRINEGTKAMSRAGWMTRHFFDSMLGYYDLVACDPQFKPYGYRILEPLESVDQGGMLETYAYVPKRCVTSEFHNAAKNVIEVWNEEGHGQSSPEECLNDMLEWTRGGLTPLPQFKNLSNKQLLEILKQAAENIPLDLIQGLPMRISSVIKSIERQVLLDLAEEMGWAVTEEEVENYIYVHTSPKRIPAREKTVDESATFRVDLSTAIKKMVSLKDLRIDKCFEYQMERNELRTVQVR